MHSQEQFSTPLCIFKSYLKSATPWPAIPCLQANSVTKLDLAIFSTIMLNERCLSLPPNTEIANGEGWVQFLNPKDD